jgi:rRNA maturation RNase YbeY
MPIKDTRIAFFSDGTTFSLKDRVQRRHWLLRVAKTHGKNIASLNYVFLSDKGLLKMNKQFLDHDTLTDIITFPGDRNPNGLTGEIYISIDRVRDNAKAYKQTMKDELDRVMAHGLLHLCGFKDKSPKDEKSMRHQEEKALNLRTR